LFQTYPQNEGFTWGNGESTASGVDIRGRIQDVKEVGL
jgi:hypothetical protein